MGNGEHEVEIKHLKESLDDLKDECKGQRIELGDIRSAQGEAATEVAIVQTNQNYMHSDIREIKDMLTVKTVDDTKQRRAMWIKLDAMRWKLALIWGGILLLGFILSFIGVRLWDILMKGTQ